MAAQKTKSRKFPQDEYEISLLDALDALLPPGQVETGDQWVFAVDGTILRITRSRAAEESPANANPQATRQ